MACGRQLTCLWQLCVVNDHPLRLRGFSTPGLRIMPRTDRLFDLLRLLRDGNLHTAQEMAQRLGVSVRTIYRDMDMLQASGVPVEGERGAGYKATGAIALPPLSLTPEELEALNLGIAIVAEAGDPDLARAAASLADKVDAVLPEQAISDAESWKFAVTPFANATRGFAHMPTLRSAIKARQKLRLRHLRPDGSPCSRTVRPLLLESWGRVWALTAWCEMREDFRVFRLDLMEEATALPELFSDEPGKTLADFEAKPV